MNPIEVRTADERELQLWRATAELAATLPRGSWTLIGAQMVFLIAYEYDLAIGRTSGDVDVLMDIRAVTAATQEASATLGVSGMSWYHRPLTGARTDFDVTG